MAQQSKAYLVLLGHGEQVGDPAHICQLGTATDTFQVQHTDNITHLHTTGGMYFTAFNHVTMCKQAAQLYKLRELLSKQASSGKLNARLCSEGRAGGGGGGGVTNHRTVFD